MTSFRHSFLRARSDQFTEPPVNAFDGEYGVGFFGTSWDERSLSSTFLTGLRLRVGIVLRTVGSTQEVLHYSQLCDFLRSRGARIHEVSTDVLDLGTTWASLLKELSAAGDVFGRPSFVDLSVSPIFYSVGLIAGLLRYGGSEMVDVLYSEAEYVPTDAATAADVFSFSFGQWRSVPIPFLEGTPQPTSTKTFCISVGFEGSKTLRVLSKSDPDSISVLMPIPGYQPSYESEVRSRNRALIENYRVPEERIRYCPAGDAVAAWKTLETRTVDRRGEDVYYLCCGTKPHSLGLALRALTAEYPCVLYNAPERLNETMIRPSGQFWRYRLTDLSAGFRRRAKLDG